MAEARDRDRIAEQYAGGFADVFDLGLPAFRRALARWEEETWAAAAAYLTFLSVFPDSHIARKFGGEAAEALRRRAMPLAARLAVADRPTALAASLLDFDRDLKQAGLNPGTSADLTVATLFVYHLELGLARS
jgi:triphosphoribosyl-dephospho-CoA synthase